MRTCKYIGDGAENVAPRSVKAAHELVGKPVMFIYNWDVPPPGDPLVGMIVPRFGVVEDSYFDNIKISKTWCRITSVLEMSPVI